MSAWNSCGGYRTCDNATIIAPSGLDCDGYKSCMTAHMTLDGHLDCEGYLSCANSVYIEINSAARIRAEAQQSAYNVTHLQLGGTADSEAFGLYSLAMSNIYLASSATLQLYGHLSGANSIIQSNASSVNINFYGATSGHNATIFCNSGHTCNIKCHGDACDDLTLHHAGGDLNITCSNDAHKSDICPLGLEISSFMTQVMNMPEPNLFTNFTEFYLTGDSQCNSSDRVLCDERSACNYDDWSGNATSRALCCFGQISCQYSDWDSSTTGFATEIRCPGSISCEAVLNAGSGGNVYLTGYASGYDAEVTTTRDYNVYCTARISCQVSNIRSANNVYCLAYQACQNSGISGVNNVYSFAYNSLESGTVSGVSGNVYCNSYESCYRVRLTHIGGSVYAQGFLSLGQVDYVLNVQNIVAAFGYQAMYQLDLQNASAVYCDGTLCLQEGDVSSVPKIVVNGSDCLQDAFIQSDLFGKRTESYFSLEIYGSNSVEFTVECTLTQF